MRLHLLLAGAVVGLLIALPAAHPAAGQPATVGCQRPSVSTTMTTRALGPSIASHPALFAPGVFSNGLTAFFPELVEVTTITNYKGVEGLTRTTVHSSIFGDRMTYLIPEWLLRAYAGDARRILADVESGRLFDVGPCP
jgi:hypothetical protein